MKSDAKSIDKTKDKFIDRLTVLKTEVEVFIHYHLKWPIRLSNLSMTSRLSQFR